MLFRRVLKHVTDQNWTAVFIDLVIVVIGVFLGIQVANWNETRELRNEEAGHLRALENDIAFSIANLETLLENFEQQQAVRERLYEFGRDPTMTLSPREIDGLLQGGLYNIQRIRVSQAAFDVLKNAGGFSAIGDPKLIAELQTLDALLVAAKSGEDEDFQITFMYSDAFLIEAADIENLLLHNTVGDYEVLEFVKGREEASMSIEDLRSTRLKNLVLYRAEITRGRMVRTRQLLDQYAKIQALIDARQIELGVSE